MTKTIDRKQFVKLISLIEADAHAAGWDNRPTLHVIFETSDERTVDNYSIFTTFGKAIAAETYIALPIVPSEMISNPSKDLFVLATNISHHLDHPAVENFIATLRQPGFRGLALTCEAWGIEAPTRDAFPNVISYADIPGGYELRSTMAVDANGQPYAVYRRRGTKPETHFDNIAGSVIESLKILVAVITGAEPPTPEYRIRQKVFSADGGTTAAVVNFRVYPLHGHWVGDHSNCPAQALCNQPTQDTP